MRGHQVVISCSDARICGVQPTTRPLPEVPTTRANDGRTGGQLLGLCCCPSLCHLEYLPTTIGCLTEQQHAVISQRLSQRCLHTSCSLKCAIEAVFLSVVTPMLPHIISDQCAIDKVSKSAGNLRARNMSACQGPQSLRAALDHVSYLWV